MDKKTELQIINHLFVALIGSKSKVSISLYMWCRVCLNVVICGQNITASGFNWLTH